MVTHREPSLLHNLSHHPRWRQQLIRRKSQRHKQTDVQNDPVTVDNLSPLSPVLRPKSRWGNWLILSLLMVVCLPCEAWPIYKVAIIGPWTCDPIFSNALPEIAARLATNRINKDPYIKAYWYEYSIVNEDCRSSRALALFPDLESYGCAFLGPANPAYCSSAALYAKNWDKGLLSWGCLKPNMHEGQYPTFLRPLPLSSRVLFSVLRFFSWAHVAIVSAEDDLWVATGNELASSLRTLGLPVSTVVTMEMGKGGPRKALDQIQNADRVKVVIMCMHSVLIGGHSQYQLLTTAMDMHMIDHGFIFIPYDTLLYALPYKDASYSVLTNDTKLRKAYDGVLTITMDQGFRNFYEAFKDAQDSNEIHTTIQPEQVSPFFGTIYNMLYFIAMSVEQARRDGGRSVSGAMLAKAKGGFHFTGFNQPLTSGSDGEGMQGRYVVLDTDGMSADLYSTHVLEASHTFGKYGDLKSEGRAIHFAGTTPSTDSECWFSPYFPCTEGMNNITQGWLALLGIVVTAGGVALAIYLRENDFCINYEGICHSGGGSDVGDGVVAIGSMKMVLTLDDLTFINTSLSKKKLDEDSVMKSQSEMQTPRHSVSGRSFLATTPENSNVAIFEGDLVWLKKCPDKGTEVKESEIKETTQAVFAKLRDMRHENINLYLGLFCDEGIFGIVTEHCTRGSLEDLLNNEDMRLDWMFKSSLLMDLIRGMKYLHNRNIIHGRLKSRNCVVDGRFVLKVTDYGFNEILLSERIQPDEDEPEDLLWTAPEHLRVSRALRKGTFSGDVYSFAIIMQEVISRCAPFCMLDMPAKEIISKVKCPPPLCRPSVSVDEAPLEVIQIMKQCWSENPSKRPTYEEIFKQIKSLAKGKKTNIIDSMLRMLEQYSSNLEDLIRERTEELEVERQKTDHLLAQMLPKSVAQALKTGKPVKPEHFSIVTLYFSDIVGFTTISALSEPIEVVDLLNDLYTLFDAIIGQHDVYKVETIGDAYMVASGVPNRNGNRHAAEMCNLSLDILHCIGAFRMRHMPDVKVRIRIGLHAGPVVAGVVGLTMPRYCLFGDTVNTASRMESTSLPYRIHINRSVTDILKELNMGYKIDTRGLTELKGKGIEYTYWLVGREGFTKPLPTPPDLDTGPGGLSHAISVEEIPEDRRQKFLDRQAKMA